MSKIIPCPHCQSDLEIPPELYGEKVQCPACGGKLTIDAPARQAAGGGKQERSGWQEKDHANAGFFQSLAIGIGITTVFLLCMIPLKGNRLGDIFLDRGWVNYGETFLFFWGMTIMALKYVKNKHQQEAALLNLFPAKLGQEINVTTVGAFIDNIYGMPLKLRDSIIVNRIRKALELFESRNSNNETASFLQTQSDLDASRSVGSYAFIKVFLWAIPILGFIGTVMGLSSAVGSLAMGDNTDPEALKNSINNLTGGLGVAFDTTLLGLILSMLMSFPLSAVQKQEDETLTLIDTFCSEKLLPKLNDAGSATGDILKEHADNMPELVRSLAKAHETFLVNLNASTMQIKETSQLLHQRLEQNQRVVEESFTDAVAKLSETSDELFRRAKVEMNENLGRLADGIDLVNVSLRKLGEAQIPAVARKKGIRKLFGG